jgi:hypothetical protein
MTICVRNEEIDDVLTESDDKYESDLWTGSGDDRIFRQQQ